MAERWIPCDLLAFSPTIRNFFENPTTVQFDHRRLVSNISIISFTVCGKSTTAFLFKLLDLSSLFSIFCHLKCLCMHFMFKGETTVTLITTLFLLSKRATLPPRAYTAATALVTMAWIQVRYCFTNMENIMNLINYLIFTCF